MVGAIFFAIALPVILSWPQQIFAVSVLPYERARTVLVERPALGIYRLKYRVLGIPIGVLDVDMIRCVNFIGSTGASL